MYHRDNSRVRFQPRKISVDEKVDNLIGTIGRRLFKTNKRNRKEKESFAKVMRAVEEYLKEEGLSSSSFLPYDDMCKKLYPKRVGDEKFLKAFLIVCLLLKKQTREFLKKRFSESREDQIPDVAKYVGYWKDLDMESLSKFSRQLTKISRGF
jgi:hypothetical protein